MSTTKFVYPYALTLSLIAPLTLGAVPLEPTQAVAVTAPAQDPYTIALDDVSASEVIKMIGNMTERTVIPLNRPVLESRRVSIESRETMGSEAALAMLLDALRYAEIGVIELDDRFIFDSIGNLATRPDVPVLAPGSEWPRGLHDSAFIRRVIEVRGSAVEIADAVQTQLPEYAGITLVPGSNRLVLAGDVGLCRRMETLCRALDDQGTMQSYRTFPLEHVHASEVAERIVDLFEPVVRVAGRQTRIAPAQLESARFRVATSPNGQAVTVVAASVALDAIEDLVTNVWDRPRGGSN